MSSSGPTRSRIALILNTEQLPAPYFIIITTDSRAISPHTHFSERCQPAAPSAPTLVASPPLQPDDTLEMKMTKMSYGQVTLQGGSPSSSHVRYY